MNEIYYIIALISAGAALITGLISLMIGFSREGEPVNRVFGLMNICFFIFILFPPTGYIINDKPPYALTLEVKRAFVWAYYILMPFFFEAYTGFRKKYVALVVTITALLAYLLMVFTGTGDIVPAWRVWVYLPLGMILAYGFLLGQLQFRTSSKTDARWLMAALLLYAFSFSMSLFEVFGGAYFASIFEQKPFFPFHINTLAFIFIMALRIRASAFQKYRLAHALRLRNEGWEKFLDTVQTIIVKLDREGNIIYMNPFAIQRLEYRQAVDVLGRNLFEDFMKKEEAGVQKLRFRQILESGISAEHERGQFLTGSGRERLLRWTGVISKDDEGTINGVMLIAQDTSDLDKAMHDVETLKRELQKEKLQVHEAISEKIPHSIIGNSAAITYAIQKALQVASTNASVLLEGETGVGKELFAELIHDNSSRRERPLIKVNCAALPPELIESELFGHEKGSFTGAMQARKGRFELANGGTIFLDEIGEMPLSLQPKLLRVLQSGEFERIGGQQTIKVDVRVISATNRELSQEIMDGRFREDLFYRLNVFPITIPALRNRKEDIHLLVKHFIRQFAREYHSQVDEISRADLQRLVDYNWPGNIRELMNLVERSMISSPGQTLRIDWKQQTNGEGSQAVIANQSIWELEKSHILKILQETGWRINGPGGAAEKLGLNPNTLRSRLKKLNISREHP